MRSLVFTALIAVVGIAMSLGGFVVPPVSLAPTKYQKWAHYHWAWVKNSDGNQANVTALYKGYLDNKIPLGAINIDSTWATQFNNFEVDTTRFPDFPALIKELHANNLKVILWYVLSFTHSLTHSHAHSLILCLSCVRVKFICTDYLSSKQGDINGKH
jgi:hypothetical protein